MSNFDEQIDKKWDEIIEKIKKIPIDHWKISLLQGKEEFKHILNNPNIENYPIIEITRNDFGESTILQIDGIKINTQNKLEEYLYKVIAEDYLLKLDKILEQL